MLGVTGVVESFGLLYLGERLLNLDRSTLQSIIYLKLSIAGHLTIFVTRTKGPLWSIKPAQVLWMAVLGTQLLATFIAVYVLFMTPIGWGWAGGVWIYSLGWFLVEDWVKQQAYGLFNHSHPMLLKGGLKRLMQVRLHPHRDR